MYQIGTAGQSDRAVISIPETVAILDKNSLCVSDSACQIKD